MASRLCCVVLNHINSKKIRLLSYSLLETFFSRSPANIVSHFGDERTSIIQSWVHFEIVNSSNSSVRLIIPSACRAVPRAALQPTTALLDNFFSQCMLRIFFKCRCIKTNIKYVGKGVWKTFFRQNIMSSNFVLHFGHVEIEEKKLTPCCTRILFLVMCDDNTFTYTWRNSVRVERMYASCRGSYPGIVITWFGRKITFYSSFQP